MVAGVILILLISLKVIIHSFTCFGNTNSYNLPYTNNALDSIYGGYGENTNMRTDMIIANISNDFNDLNYLSYLGGNQTDSLFNVLRESGYHSSYYMVTRVLVNFLEFLKEKMLDFRMLIYF